MLDSGHIFISYKSQQRHLAFQVRDTLQDWGYETWLDVDRLQPGTYWANDIDAALKSCSACVGIMTPSAIKSRYVTNEWDMAIMKGKLFLPLMFEHTEPHYKYIDIQYVDFTSDPKEDSYSQLKSRLQNHKPSSSDKPSDDPYYDYLQQLYDRINKYLSAKLITSLRDDEGRPEPIRLSSARVDGVVDALFEKREEIDPLFAIGGILDEPPCEFDEFAEVVDYFDGRVLLLGEPGSGKTITLLQHARDAIVKRYQDRSAPIPIIGVIPTWDADKQIPFGKWLTTQHGVPADIEKLTEQGLTLLLLDGLDELGSERPVDPNKPIGEKYDPRSRFLQILPSNNQVILTCRTKDYREIAEQAPVSGAVELKELNDNQIRAYLRSQPKLLEFVQSDKKLKLWLDTPLLLTFFAFAFSEAPPSIEMMVDKGSREVLDYLFDNYIRKRYEHEERKIYADLLYSIDDVYSYMGSLATYNVGHHFTKENIVTYEDAKSVIDQSVVDQVLGLGVSLHILIANHEGTYSFQHLLLRDYFAFHYAVNDVRNNHNPVERTRSAYALGNIGDNRCLGKLIVVLVSDDFVAVQRAAALSLGKLKDDRAIQPLSRALFGGHDALKSASLQALQQIGTSEALEIVSRWGNYRSDRDS
ncbi:MAG: hypothetical protein OHK0046_50680 [Anaerolineae bacterium]